jgi:hypothetical protein
VISASCSASQGGSKVSEERTVCSKVTVPSLRQK